MKAIRGINLKAIKNMDRVKLGNYVCAILLVLVIVTQLVPFWLCTDSCKEHKGTNEIVSIAEYVWFPDHHKPITKGMTNVYLNEYGADYTNDDGKKYSFAVDDIVLPLTIIFIGSTVGAVLCVVFSEKKIVTLLPAIVGGTGVYWYLSCPAMKVGASWQLHLIAALLILAAAVATLVLGFKKRLPQK